MRQKEDNNPLLIAVRNDIRLMGHVMQQFARTLVHERISQYPIFVAHDAGIAVGRPFIDRALYHTNWWYNASHLEEFVKKELIQRAKVDDFRETFGDPEERACIFMALPETSGFVFIPYRLEDEEDNPLM